MVSEFDRRELLFETGFKAGKKQGAKEEQQAILRDLKSHWNNCTGTTKYDCVKILIKEYVKRLRELEQ